VSISPLPPNPLPPPGPGPVGPLDWTGPIATYNANVVALNAIVAKINQEMERFDGLVALVKDFDVKALVATDPATKRALTLMGDAYFAKLPGHAQAILNLYNEYEALYQTVQAQSAFLRSVVPIEQLPLLAPVPPYFEVPQEYFVPIARYV
jgi:hypothetical protein